MNDEFEIKIKGDMATEACAKIIETAANIEMLNDNLMDLRTDLESLIAEVKKIGA